MREERHIGEASLDKQPEQPLRFTLKEGSVTTEKIADDAVTTPKIKDKNVTPAKLSDDVQDAIVTPLINQLDNKYENKTDELYSMVNTLQVGGVALSEFFGNRTDIGINQDTLTRAIKGIYDMLLEITGSISYWDYTLTVTPTFTYTDIPISVDITADCTGSLTGFDVIRIYVDGELVAEEVGTYVLHTTAVISSTTVIKAIGYFIGKEVVKEETSVIEMPFFMGSGSVYTDVINEECRKELVGTLEGDYDVTIKNNNDYMFVIIPPTRDHEFRRADMNGYEIPFEKFILEKYIVYKSLNRYVAGTYNVDININT